LICLPFCFRAHNNLSLQLGMPRKKVSMIMGKENVLEGTIILVDG
jgi:hypothetical protein